MLYPDINLQKRTQQNTTRYRTALYLRLSREDGDKTESDRDVYKRQVLAYTGVKFRTYSGLPFSYEIKKGSSGEYTKELWIDRRENSKSLAWSSVLLALGNIKKVGEVVERPKAPVSYTHLDVYKRQVHILLSLV